MKLIKSLHVTHSACSRCW